MMFDTGSFIGGFIVGGVFAAIITLALTTAYWLFCSKETKHADRIEKQTQIKRGTKSNGGIRYHDGLDIEYWV